MFKRRGLSVLAVFIPLSAVPPMLANSFDSDLAQGVKQYKSGSYSAAIAYLSKAASESPNDALTRYYLANAFLSSKNNLQAWQQYKNAAALDPTGQIGDYSRKALEYLRSAKQASNVEPLPEKGTKPTTADLAEQRLLNQAKQISAEKVNAGNAAADEAKSLGQRQARHIQDDADRTMDAMRKTYILTPYHERIPVYSDAEINAVQKRATAQEKDLDHYASIAAQERISQAQIHSQIVQETANNLISLMRSGTARVTGTNLYVRNYNFTNNNNAVNQVSPLPAELLATQQKLILVPHMVPKNWAKSHSKVLIGSKANFSTEVVRPNPDSESSYALHGKLLRH
jgi:hypothetical protein